MDNNVRQELFNQHVEYFQILDKLGKGIMIKPHLMEYMAKLNNTNKYKLNRDIDKLHKAKLLDVMKTKSVTIISVTSPSLMFLRNKKSVKEVSTSSVTTNRNLKMSMVKNEYIINTYLSKCNTFEELKSLLEQTNLISKTGDNEQLLKMILRKHKQDTKKKDHNFASLIEEITYIEDSKYNKALQMASPKVDDEGNEISKVMREINFTRVSINNLQARHMYWGGMSKFYWKKRVGYSEATAYTDVTIVYMEVTDLIGYQKFKRDMDILSEWLTSNVDFGKVTIDIAIEPSRREAMEDTIAQWRRKRISQFCTTNVEFNIVEIDVTNKHLKGLNIAI